MATVVANFGENGYHGSHFPILRLGIVSSYPLLGFVLVAFSTLAAPRILTPADKMPAEPFFSGDRAIRVRSAQITASYRAPVLGFIDRTRQDFLQVFRLPLQPADYLIDVEIGIQADGDTHVIVKRGRGLDGRPIDVIQLPAPDTSDLDLLRNAVAHALLRAYLTKLGGNAQSISLLPEWFTEGLWLFIGGRERTGDFDRAWTLWTEGRLPVAATLWSADSPANSDPGLQAALLACLIDRHTSNRAFQTILSEAAAGHYYDWKIVAGHLAGTHEPWAFDHFWDRWMIQEGRRILTPGLTTRGVISRFRSSLLLYPVYSDKIPPLYRLEGMDFRTAIRYAALPAVRNAAAAQAFKVRTAAAGRDENLGTVAELYARFLVMLAAGGTSDKDLAAMLKLAETERARFEQTLEASHGALRTAR